MSLRITTNVEAFNAYRNLNGIQNQISSSMEKLSSGFRINRGADDAAGLGISEAMRAQIRGLAQAQKNIQDGVSLVQTAEGNLGQVHSMLQRVRELAVQYGNGAISTDGKNAIQTEVNQLASEISRVMGQAKFNGISLLTGAEASVTFQVGANDGETILVSMGEIGNVKLTTNNWADLSVDKDNMISRIDSAITAVSAKRSTLGAVQNRLENAMQVQAAYQENVMAAESRIRDVDIANEMVAYTKNQILAQAGTAMLSQANQSPQQVLALLR